MREVVKIIEGDKEMVLVEHFSERQFRFRLIFRDGDNSMLLRAYNDCPTALQGFDENKDKLFSNNEVIC